MVAEVGRTDYVTDDALLYQTTFHISAWLGWFLGAPMIRMNCLRI
jgi:hypothetical protein